MVFCHGELTPDFDWTTALKGIDVVVHLAGMAHVRHGFGIKENVLFRNINVLGTQNLAQQAGKLGVQRFIFVSSIGVNGQETFERPFKESDKPAPASLYAQSKLEAELLLQDLGADSGMEWVILRPPLIYGPDAPGNMKLLMMAVERGLPLPFASVRNQRSLLACANIAELIALCLDHPAAANQLFLVADGEDISTSMLVRLLAHGMGRSARLFPVPLGLIEVGARMLGQGKFCRQLVGSLQIDCSKVMSMLGWSPTITTENGIMTTAKKYADKEKIHGHV